MIAPPQTTPAQYAFRFILALLAMVLALATLPARAEQEVIAPVRALELARSHSLLIVDIRSRAEWRQSAIALPAHTISMHEPGFIKKLRALRQSRPQAQVALICATGARSAWLQKELQRRGLTGIIDISEGMIGNGTTTGWIARGLPTRPFDG